MRAPLAVSSWSVVSAFGIGAQEFSDGLASGRVGVRTSLQDDPAPLAESAVLVPDFDIRQLLGRKGTRSMDRITGLTVLTVGRLLDGERAAGHELDGDETGLVLGTTTGSVQSMMDFTRDSFTQAKPYMVDPACFPNAVMNCAAGQSAIWHGLRGPNTTMAGGQVAGLSVLRYAARLHRSRHARTVLCGAVEELSPQRAWLERQRQDDTGSAVLGEGCAIFRLESPEDASAAGRAVLAYFLATAFRVYTNPAEIPGVLADCATSVLKAADASPEDVWAVAADLTETQHAGIRQVVGDSHRTIGLRTALGDTGGASAALGMAAVLSHADADETSRGKLALVVSVDRDGSAGVAALRLPADLRR